MSHGFGLGAWVLAKAKDLSPKAFFISGEKIWKKRMLLSLAEAWLVWLR